MAEERTWLRVMMTIAVVMVGVAAWQVGPEGETSVLLGGWTFQSGATVTEAEFRPDGTAVIGINRYRFRTDREQEPWHLDLVGEDGRVLAGVFQVSADGDTVDLAYRPAPERRPRDPASGGMRLMRDREDALALAREELRRWALYARLER